MFHGTLTVRIDGVEFDWCFSSKSDLDAAIRKVEQAQQRDEVSIDFGVQTNEGTRIDEFSDWLDDTVRSARKIRWSS